MRVAKLRPVFLLVLVISVFITGCVPVCTRYVSAPGAVGRAVDGDSHVPLVGAVVSVARPDGPPAQSRTRRDGTFRVPSQHRLFVRAWLGRCKHVLISSAATMSVEHQGYHSQSADIPAGTEVFEAGEVRLYRPAP